MNFQQRPTPTQHVFLDGAKMKVRQLRSQQVAVGWFHVEAFARVQASYKATDDLKDAR